MGREDILKNIKETEAAVKKDIDDANKKKDEKIENAKKNAKKIEEYYDIKAKQEQDKLVALTKRNIEKERKKIIDKGLADASTIRNNANIPKSKEFFIDRFDDHIKK